MRYLLGCFGLIIAIVIIIAIVQWLFSNLIGILGLALAIWAGYQWYQNGKLGAKSKMPVILLAVGLIIMVIGFSANSKDEIVQEEQEKKVEEKANKLVEKKSKPAETKETTSPAPLKTTDTSGTTDKIPVELVEVIDGDTIKIIYEGKEQKVRYLLVDTPETNHPKLGEQPFGKEAKERNQELLENGNLEIEFDVGERFDKYNRLLAYIYVDGKSVQKMLLSEGLARVAYVYPPNTRHLNPFEKSQDQAKQQKLGIWSVENYVTEQGFDDKKVVDSKPATAKPANNDNKQNSTPPAETPKPAEKPPVTPAPQETEWFQNCTELRKKYPSGVPESHPAYQPKMDRDKDGWACE